MERVSGPLDVPEGRRELLVELQRRITEVDPEAHLTDVSFDDYGVMRVRASCSPESRREVKQLLRECESQMLTRCELCGGEGRLRGGVVLTVRCEQCA